MTYFGFLTLFLGAPIVLLAAWLLLERAHGKGSSGWQLGRTSGIVIALHVAIALVYTTPWDNYLVATGVWWYDPALVTGLTLGWVPIEEYAFFIMQPIFSGLFLLAVLQRLQPIAAGNRPSLRAIPLLFTGTLWLLSLAILLGGWQPGTYLALELGWALPPIILQLSFGADILWRYRHGVLLAVMAPTVFLSAADALAIGSGIWTINPAQSLQLLIGAVLPLEEFIFFLLTNTLIAFGVTLSLAPQSRERFYRVAAWLRSRVPLAKRNLRRTLEI